MAAVAVASGVEVSLWLTGESAGSRCRAGPPSSSCRTRRRCPICSIVLRRAAHPVHQCAARRDITEKDVCEGVRIAGAQVFVQEALGGVQALVY